MHLSPQEKDKLLIVTAALLATNLTIGMMSRASPQLNIFAIGFPLTLSVGLLGNGSLGVTGGRIESFQGIIGSGTGGVGAATITGGTWAINQDLSVGGDGAGTLTIADGGSVIVVAGLAAGDRVVTQGAELLNQLR